MELLNWAANNAILTVILMFLACLTMESLCRKTMRMLMVRKSGWPPAHLDADGDFADFDEDEQS